MVATTIYKPKSVLNEFVECFYFNTSNEFEFTGFTEPTIYQELFFNLGDHFEITNSNGRLTQEKNWISGIQTKSNFVKCRGKHITAGVIFKPWALHTAFNINAQSVTNKTINNKLLADLEKELCNCKPDINMFFEIVEHHLIKSINRAKTTALMEKIVNALTEENINNLPDKIQCSHKTVIAIFNKIIGITPKQFLTLKSICNSITILQHNPTLKLTELAYKQGFYDQAHFIRVFKAHTGLTPSAFRKKNL